MTAPTPGRWPGTDAYLQALNRDTTLDPGTRSTLRALALIADPNTGELPGSMSRLIDAALADPPANRRERRARHKAER